LFALAGLSTLVAILTSILRDRGGRGGRLAGEVIERTWTVATYLIVPVIILEDVPFFKSLDRAKTLHWRNFVPIAIGEVAVSVVNGVLLTFIIFGLMGAGIYLRLAQPTAFMTFVVIGGIIFIASVCFTEFVRISYYTCLYLWAAEREKVGEQARIPTPLAAALGH
jgi:hypothetical protein